MDENICVTVELVDRPGGEQPEPFFIESSLKWQDLEAMLGALYDTPQKELDVRYLDNDNDKVIMSSQEELSLAIQYCKETENVLQLLVQSKDQQLATSDIIQDACPAAAEKVETAVSQGGTSSECPTGADHEHVMVPGATSGANAVAIEMPECPMEVPEESADQTEKQEAEGAEKEDTPVTHVTEAAEPAEMAETGEVAPKSGRDAETGYWMITAAGKKRKTPGGSNQKGELEIPLEGAIATLEKQTVVMKNLKKRDRQAETLKAEKRHKADKESKDDLAIPGPVSGNMSFPVFVAFMGKLKKELRSEIVHDVTRKTVKQVLRGLETMHQQAHRQEPGIPAEGKTRANNWPVFTHDEILCDNCENTIVGSRYKCGNCLNYDLCEECESQAGVHDENHVFIKLRRPCPMAGYRHGKRILLLKHLIYTTKIIEECLEPEFDRSRQSYGEIDMEKLARKAEKLKHMQLKMREKLARKEEKLKRRYERLSIQAKEQLPLLKRERIDIPYGILGAEFVRDVTLPDGVVVQPGEQLTKTWRMRNSGTMVWPAGTVLREMWSSMPAERAKVSVPQVTPGSEVDITVYLIAPSTKGRYESHWRLHCNGRLVGHNVYCIVQVEEDLNTEPEIEPVTAVVPMLKELCSDMGNLGSKMIQLTISDADEQEFKAEEEKLPEQGDHDQEEERGDGEEEAGVRASTAGPMSVAGMNSLLSFVMVDVERPDRPRRPSPAVVKQSYEDKDFWIKKLSAFPGQGEPATPNNTPLDVSPPPERIIPIPEPELLRKLSLEAGASPQQDAQEPDQPPCSDVSGETTVIKEEAETSSVDATSLEQSDKDASPASVALLEPTPVGPHQEIEGDVVEPTGGQTPRAADAYWWEERESSPVSTASSVEVMSAGELEGDAEAEKTADLSEYMAQRTIFPPHGWTEDLAYDHLDVESLDSLSDEDSSIDDDFFIVKLPDCFDTSKPLVYNPAPSHSSASSFSEYLVQQKRSADEDEEEEEAEPTAEVEEQDEVTNGPSLDDMLQASGSITAPTLVPTIAPTSVQAPASPDTPNMSAQGSEDTSNVEAAAGEFQDAQESPEDDGARSRSDDSAADATSSESTPVVEERPSAESGGAEGGAAAGATSAEDDMPLDPSQQVNQLMQSAVAVASKAAVRAFTTAKDVFYTLQARQYEWKPSTWKPPQSTWKPPQSTWKPPQSKWTPPESEWKPPADNWKPPQETLPKELAGESGVDEEGEQGESPVSEPMKRLWEMGFFNRTLNQQLLDKHNGDLEPVVQELLQDLDNDWAETRH